MIPMIAHLSTNNYTFPSTFDFVHEITNFSHPQPLIMVSFDIESLFTNIPLMETIDIIISQLFTDNNSYHGFNEKQFRNLLMLSCTENLFLFNDSLYKQHEGVQMGGSMGPVLANIFMCYMETKWLEQCPKGSKPLFYKRYVDDTFLLFNNLDQVQSFHTFLNSQHPNIKFTIELECEGKLPFIGISVSHNNLSFSTSVYRKPTDTGLGMQFTSFNQSSFKTNSIMTLLHRCFMICSSREFFHSQVEYLYQYYTSNGFPTSVFWRCVKKFLYRVRNPPVPTFDVPRDVQYISLPFLGHHSYNLRNRLQSIFKLHFPQVNARIILSNKNTIGSMFPTKDRLPMNVCSNVIYRFQCKTGDECTSSYIGSTTRRIGERICEHMGVSFLTGNKLSDPRSSIFNHCLKTGHRITEDSFEILGGCREEENILLLESVYIKYYRPNLNNMESAYPLQLT